MNTRSSSFASDELLSRLDGLLADLRALRAEVHELSTDATVDARRDNGETTKTKMKTKTKHKKRQKAKGKKKDKARND